MRTPDFTKVKIAGPITFSGPAVESDARIFDHNDSEPADVSVWVERMQKQDADIARGNAEFFEELRRRKGQ